MRPELGIEIDSANLRQDWVRVGGYLTQAMQEVALNLGGEDLAKQVILAGASDDILPNPDALKLLEEFNPGTTQLVLTRMSEIQQETHQRELDQIRKPSLRKFGKSILDGFATFNIFGNPPRKR